MKTSVPFSVVTNAMRGSKFKLKTQNKKKHPKENKPEDFIFHFIAEDFRRIFRKSFNFHYKIEIEFEIFAS